jgi:hypothetical protein
MIGGRLGVLPAEGLGGDRGKRARSLTMKNNIYFFLFFYFTYALNISSLYNKVGIFRTFRMERNFIA